jgi:multidrug transporter EmrE-like cation transporter
MVTLGAVVLFQESINFRRVIGLAVIIVGIIIVGGE